MPNIEQTNQVHSHSLFLAIKDYYDHMSWINWLLSKHVFKSNSSEFKTLIELETELDEFKKLHRDHLTKLQRLNTDKERALSDYIAEPSLNKYERIVTTINIMQQDPVNIKHRFYMPMPFEATEIIDSYYTDVKGLKTRIEERRNELIHSIEDYVTNNKGYVHEDKIQVMEVLLAHLQDPENVEKKDALMKAINTKPNWAHHFFKSRTLEAVQTAQELLEVDEQIKKIS